MESGSDLEAVFPWRSDGSASGATPEVVQESPVERPIGRRPLRATTPHSTVPVDAADTLSTNPGIDAADTLSTNPGIDAADTLSTNPGIDAADTLSTDRDLDHGRLLPDGGTPDSRFRSLHDAASDLSTADSTGEAYGIAVDTAERLLDFHVCEIFERDEDELRLVATSRADTAEETFDLDQGIVGRTHREGKTILVEDAEADSDADPTDESYRSAVSVPIGDWAVLQAISTETGYYDRQDLEVAELLVAHVETAIDRIETERLLRTQKRQVEQLHALATELESCHTHEELFDLVIESAAEVLGFKWSAVSTVEDGRFVIAAISESAPVEVGDRPMAADEGMAGWAYQNNEPDLTRNTAADERSEPVDEAFRSALAVPIGDVGVFAAVSDEVEAFDETDVELTELLASNVLEAYHRIEVQRRLRDRREELDLLEQVQSRVLRHNLRNDISVVRGLAERLCDDGEGDIERIADRIIDKTDELATTSTKARELERVLERRERTQEDLAAVAADVVDRLREEHPDAVLQANLDPGAVRAHPDLEMAIENVVENAIVHNDGRAHVEVSVDDDGSLGVLRVADDGPGIPKHEVDVITRSRETDLEHGSGVGLWLVRLIVDRSGGDLSFERQADGTVVELAFPAVREES